MNNLFNKTAEKGSVRNVILIFVAILLVGGSFVVAEYKNSKAKNTYNASMDVSMEAKNLEAGNLDTDSDGLKDWEEILQGSDPRDAKSKGEMAKKPVIEGDVTARKEPLSSTDILSRDFFARYMELRQMGVSDDKQSQEDAVRQSLNNSLVLAQPKVYTTANIVIDSNTGKDTVKAYGNKMGVIFKTYSLQSRNEAVIAKEASDKQDEKILRELDPIITNYKKILAEMIKVPVPSTMSQMHLDFINSLSGVIFVDELFRKSYTDPISGLQAAGSYIRYADGFTAAYNGIRGYFTFLGITYTAEEGGSIFQPKF